MRSLSLPLMNWNRTAAKNSHAALHYAGKEINSGQKLNAFVEDNTYGDRNLVLHH